MKADDLSKLADKFPAEDLEWRIGRAGLKRDRAIWATALPYLTNRAVMCRLDEVCGPGGWRNEFVSWSQGKAQGILCGLSIRVEHEWITKWDGAEPTNVEALKGGLSAAMKRAAAQWGIGRYLADVEGLFAVIARDDDYTALPGNLRDGQKERKFRWHPPELPAWALPGPRAERNGQDEHSQPSADDPARTAAPEALGKLDTLLRDRPAGYEAVFLQLANVPRLSDLQAGALRLAFAVANRFPREGDLRLWQRDVLKGKTFGQMDERELDALCRKLVH
jgi:hypothetical protein